MVRRGGGPGARTPKSPAHPARPAVPRVHRTMARRHVGVVQPLAGSLAGASRSRSILRGRTGGRTGSGLDVFLCCASLGAWPGHCDLSTRGNGVRSSFIPPASVARLDQKHGKVLRSPNSRLSADPKPRPDLIAELRVRAGVVLGWLGRMLWLRNKMPLDLPGHEHTVSAAALEDDNLFVRFGNRGQTTVSALAKKST